MNAALQPSRIASECPLCERPLRRQTRRSDGGAFLSCTGFPVCKFSEDIDLSVQRIERELRAARNDVEYMRAWIRVLETHLREHTSGCDECKRHIADIKRFL